MTSIYAHGQTGKRRAKKRHERCTSGTISNGRGNGAPEYTLDAPLLVEVSQHVEDTVVPRRTLSLDLEQDLCPLDRSRDQRRRDRGHKTSSSDL